MKTLIAVPCMDQVPARFAQSLAMLRKVGDCAVSFQIGSLVYNSRNELARRAIQMDADYVLWLDSDMVFDPDLLERMFARMESDNLDFLTGLCFRRTPPFSPAIFDKLEYKKGVVLWTDYHGKVLPNEPFEVGGCGFAAVLIKTDVIMSVQAKHQAMFTPMQNTGEDLSFCLRARDCGFRIVCDPTIELGHIGYNIVTREFYTMFTATANKEVLK